MGLPFALEEVSASPVLFDDGSSNNGGSVDSPVPAPAALQDPHLLAAAVKFVADVKAAGGDIYSQMLLLLLDYRKHGFHPGFITRVEELFQGHRDLLVAFNTFLPEGCQCTVPELVN